MGKKKPKPVYLRVRGPQIKQTGGAHTPVKGGKYRRPRAKEESRQAIKEAE